MKQKTEKQKKTENLSVIASSFFVKNITYFIVIQEYFNNLRYNGHSQLN